MQRLQAFKFELMPGSEQQRDMRRFAGACRFVCNKALALQKTNYEAGGKWFASIQTEREVPQSLPTATTSIGIDVGIARFATMSGSSFIAPLNSFKKHEQRLARYQRRMSCKVKFSKNWNKAKRKVQKIHAHIGNARKDFLHKATTAISQNHAMVAIEDLQVGNMSKSSKGTTDASGKNVAAKSGLNKAVLDQGWGEFRRQLEYKLNWNGGMLIPVPAPYTSQTCPACGEDGSGRGRKTPMKPASVKQETTEVTTREVTHV